MKIGGTGGGVDISLLANGIWEALITTIGGLTVGIIMILFYNYLVGKVEDFAQQLEENSNEFIFSIRRIKDEN
jgi:biopolymer transport protein ExbB